MFCRWRNTKLFNDGQQSLADGSPLLYLYYFQMVINYMVHHHQQQHLDEISVLFVGLTNWWPADPETSLVHSEIRNVLFRLIDYVPQMNILGSILYPSDLCRFGILPTRLLLQYIIRGMWLGVVQTKYVTRVICHSIWIRIIGNHVHFICFQGSFFSFTPPPSHRSEFLWRILLTATGNNNNDYDFWRILTWNMHVQCCPAALRRTNRHVTTTTVVEFTTLPFDLVVGVVAVDSAAELELLEFNRRTCITTSPHRGRTADPFFHTSPLPTNARQEERTAAPHGSSS